jgi:hypothetical protein
VYFDNQSESSSSLLESMPTHFEAFLAFLWGCPGGHGTVGKYNLATFFRIRSRDAIGTIREGGLTLRAKLRTASRRVARHQGTSRRPPSRATTRSAGSNSTLHPS